MHGFPNLRSLRPLLTSVPKICLVAFVILVWFLFLRFLCLFVAILDFRFSWRLSDFA